MKERGQEFMDDKQKEAVKGNDFDDTAATVITRSSVNSTESLSVSSPSTNGEYEELKIIFACESNTGAKTCLTKLFFFGICTLVCSNTIGATYIPKIIDVERRRVQTTDLGQ